MNTVHLLNNRSDHNMERELGAQHEENTPPPYSPFTACIPPTVPIPEPVDPNSGETFKEETNSVSSISPKGGEGVAAVAVRRVVIEKQELLPPEDASPAALLSFKLERVSIIGVGENAGGCLHLKYAALMTMTALMGWSVWNTFIFLIWLFTEAVSSSPVPRSEWRRFIEIYYVVNLVGNLLATNGVLKCVPWQVAVQPLLLGSYFAVKCLRFTYFERDYRYFWDTIEFAGTCCILWIWVLLWRWTRYFGVGGHYVATMHSPPWTDGAVRAIMSAKAEPADAQHHAVAVELQPDDPDRNLPAEGV